MSYALPTPGRAWHMRNIHDVPTQWTFCVHDEVDIDEDKDDLRMGVNPQDVEITHRLESQRKDHQTSWILPNDSGALVGLGTTRLPLRRHDTAAFFWAYLGCLGEPGDSPFSVVETARTLINNVRNMLLNSYRDTAPDFAKDFLDPTIAYSYDFTACFCVTLQHRAFETTLASFLPIAWLYIDLCGSGIQRPSEIDNNDWIFELQRKSSAKWICNWEDQHAAAKPIMRLAEAREDAGQHHDALWFWLRALIELLPWIPTEWYLATWEIAIPYVQLYFFINVRIAHTCLVLGHHDMAYAFATVVIDNCLSTELHRWHALSTIVSCLQATPESDRLLKVTNHALVSRRRALSGIPEAEWPEVIERDSTGTAFSVEKAAARSFAQNFTPIDYLRFDAVWRYTTNFVPRPPVFSPKERKAFEVTDKRLQKQWNTQGHENPKRCCWSILELHNEVPSLLCKCAVRHDEWVGCSLSSDSDSKERRRSFGFRIEPRCRSK